jgi:hypothetical protein
MSVQPQAHNLPKCSAIAKRSPPSTLDALANDPARKGAIVFVVHVGLPEAS